MISVLVVDDVRAFRMLVGKALEREPDIRVAAEASDGEQAVALYRAVTPDVVTLDLNLPGKDGLSVLKAILALDPEARTVIVSGTDSDQAASLLSQGASGFVSKPVNPTQLVAEVRNAVAVSRKTPKAKPTLRLGPIGGRNTVLIVEDEPLTRAMLDRAVQLAGCAVLAEAGTLAIADQLLDQSEPSLMLLDLSLPDGEGLAWLREQRGRGRMVPTLIVTGRSDRQAVQAAHDLGAVGYVLKPVDLARVARTIAQTVASTCVAVG